MDEYRVPKEKVSILVEIPPHAPENRFVFLSSCAQSHQGAETPADVFNVPQAFIPLIREEGDGVLARRNAITWVLVGDPARTEWYYYETRNGSPTARVRLQFDTGTFLEGTIALIGPAGSQRVIDLVNRNEDFLHLERDEELFLVNLARVVAITVGEQSAGGAR
jgi:hypothetical protein